MKELPVFLDVRSAAHPQQCALSGQAVFGCDRQEIRLIGWDVGDDRGPGSGIQCVSEQCSRCATVSCAGAGLSCQTALAMCQKPLYSAIPRTGDKRSAFGEQSIEQFSAIRACRVSVICEQSGQFHHAGRANGQIRRWRYGMGNLHNTAHTNQFELRFKAKSSIDVLAQGCGIQADAVDAVLSGIIQTSLNQLTAESSATKVFLNDDHCQPGHIPEQAAQCRSDDMTPVFGDKAAAGFQVIHAVPVGSNLIPAHRCTELQGVVQVRGPHHSNPHVL